MKGLTTYDNNKSLGEKKNKLSILAMSVRVDLFLSMGSFCDLAWGPFAMKISAFLDSH